MEKIKAIFFAQYLGQKVYRRNNVVYDVDGLVTTELLHGDIFASDSNFFIANAHLLLRSIDQLTDDEYTELLNLYDDYFIGNEFEIVNFEFDSMHNNIIARLSNKYVQHINIESLNARCIDYLKLIGVLLPFTYLNEENKPITLQPEEIVSMGWAKIDK